MRFFNKLLSYQTNNFIIVKIQKKLMKIFDIYYVATNIQKLPENNYTINSHFDYQEEVVKKFNNINNLVSFNTCPKIVQILKMLFLDENLKFNFLDFGGENIDFYLYLKKNFKNINYFVHNKENINQDFVKLKERYKFENISSKLFLFLHPFLKKCKVSFLLNLQVILLFLQTLNFESS